jgi:hypothetical protein
VKQRGSAPSLNLNTSELMEIQKAAAQVSDVIPPVKKSSYLRRSTIQLIPGTYHQLLNDHYDEPRPPPFDKRGDLQNSWASGNSNQGIKYKRSRSHDTLPDADTKQQPPTRRGSGNRNTINPQGIVLEIQQPALRRSSIIGPSKIEMPKQIDAMKMLKRHSALPQEKRYLDKPGIGSIQCSPMITASTFSSTVNTSKRGLSEMKAESSKRFLSDHAISSTRDLTEMAVASSGEKRHNCCSGCGVYKRIVVIGLFILLLGLGIGGYFSFLYGPFDKSDTEEENGTFDVSRSNASAPESAAAYINATNGFEVEPSPLDIKVDIAPPPLDLEARCSVSNLPGSLSSCLMACLPSACCYAGYSGDACTDSTMCESYKP